MSSLSLWILSPCWSSAHMVTPVLPLLISGPISLGPLELEPSGNSLFLNCFCKYSLNILFYKWNLTFPDDSTSLMTLSSCNCFLSYTTGNGNRVVCSFLLLLSHYISFLFLPWPLTLNLMSLYLYSLSLFTVAIYQLLFILLTYKWFLVPFPKTTSIIVSLSRTMAP